jgi:uncharacterized tellurite resistance protein B-like protein
MSFLRFLTARPGDPTPQNADSETEAVRRIVARLEALPPDDARFLAGTAYVMARSANADMAITDRELQAIEDVLVEAGLDRAQALLVAEMARLQERTSGGTSDFLVTREFSERSTVEQRLDLLASCYRVAAAESGISAAETAVLGQIADELGLDRQQAATVRSRWADQISARWGLRPNA